MTQASYYFIGIGGIGMSALAKIAHEKGFCVSGSDARASSITDSLQDAGIEVQIGHGGYLLTKQATVVYSTEISKENPERQKALSLGCRMLHRSEMLKEVMEGSLPLLVSGTHGKTTTSSLLAHCLECSSQDPSYAIGGVVQSLKTNGHFGQGKWFVAEADESDRSFLAYGGKGGIVTNIGLDHLNVWIDEEQLMEGFLAFTRSIEDKNLFFWCADDARLSSLNLEGISYGFSQKADVKIQNVKYVGWSSIFTVEFNNYAYEEIVIPMMGEHNVLNAAAVFGLCLQLGLSSAQIQTAFSCFKGVQRRAEKKGEVNQIEVYDDYGHHPTEIAATLSAFKKAVKGRRLVVAFQPHRYSRTKECFSDFAPALLHADTVVLTDVYSAGEMPDKEVDGPSLFATLPSGGPHRYSAKETLIDDLAKLVKPGDVVVTLGAGDITQVGPSLLHRLSSV